MAFVVHKKTILGKFFTSTIELARNIGVGDPIGLGGYHTDSSVDIHLGDDTSIARQHAIIKFNEIKSCFEIETFYPIYVHGEKVIPEQGPVSLSNRTVIQVTVNYFIIIYLFYIDWL